MDNNTINRVELQGRVGTVRIQPAGNGLVASFSVHTETVYTGSEGNAVCEVVWHHVTAFESNDVKVEGLARGSLVNVKGRIRNTRYTAADGGERVFTEVLASSLKIIE